MSKEVAPSEKRMEEPGDAYSYYPSKGRVARIGAAIVPPPSPFSIGEFTKTTQRVPFRIEFENLPEDKVLLLGVSVEVKINVESSVPSFFSFRL